MQGMLYLQRHARGRLRELLRAFPAVLVHGPRQCGKSTFVHEELQSWKQVDLESPRDRDRVEGNLQGFLEANPRHVVIDEAQRLPALFPALRHFLDRGRQRGRYVLTGSASPELVQSISESLAGRVGFLELTPFRSTEIAGTRMESDRWFWGGLPPVHDLRDDTLRHAWLDGYVRTFLERDLPALGVRLAPARLRALWTMLTHVHGSLLNPTDLARSLTVSHHTVNAHLDVLEGAFMIRRLHPHFANVQKRLTKSPKVYIRDTGLLHFLAGLERPSSLETWPKRGHSFEGLVLEELCSLATERVARPYLAYWRTQAGAEVDLLIGVGERLIPIEIKLAASIGRYDARGLVQCMADLGLKQGWIVYGGTERFDFQPGVTVVPWRHVVRGECDFGLGGRARVRTRAQAAKRPRSARRA